MNNLWYITPIKLINDNQEFKKVLIYSCINATITVKVASGKLHFSEARYKKEGSPSIMNEN